MIKAADPDEILSQIRAMPVADRHRVTARRVDKSGPSGSGESASAAVIKRAMLALLVATPVGCESTVNVVPEALFASGAVGGTVTSSTSCPLETATLAGLQYPSNPTLFDTSIRIDAVSHGDEQKLDTELRLLTIEVSDSPLLARLSPPWEILIPAEPHGWEPYASFRDGSNPEAAGIIESSCGVQDANVLFSAAVDADGEFGGVFFGLHEALACRLSPPEVDGAGEPILCREREPIDALLVR